MQTKEGIRACECLCSHHKMLCLYNVQGDEADEPLETIERDGAEAFYRELIDTLPEESALETHIKLNLYGISGIPWGTSDSVHRFGDDYLVINWRLGYVSLYRAFKVEEASDV